MPRDVLHLDYETASNVDLTKVGLDIYTQPEHDPRVLMASWKFNGRRMPRWEAHEEPFPRELKQALESPDVEKWAFNAQFERIISRRLLKIKTPRKGWRCGMVLAYMHGFSGGLEDVGEQCGLPLEKQKMKDGKRLIRKFCMPQRITKNNPYEWRNWLTDPDDWEVFGEYNDQDTETEEALVHRLRPYPIPDEEWENYELDQLINDRGIPVDFDFIDNVIEMSARRKSELLARMRKITGCENPNSGSQLLPWLLDEGYPYTDLRKESVEKTLRRIKKGDPYVNMSKDGIRVLRLRTWAARTSVNKAVTARRVVTSDGQARFLYQFCGAGRTWRSSGRLIQPQNMTRTPKVFEAEEDSTRLDIATNIIRTGDYDAFDLYIREPMVALTGTMRGMFRAPDGYNFTVCDFSSIESVGLAYVSGCERMLDVFRNGRDVYRDFGTMFYSKAYEEITRAERQICKPPALGCGYRLSAGKDEGGIKTGLLAYAENMGVEMTLGEAKHAVTTFRTGYPEVPEYWYECERAARYVMRTHKSYDVGCVTYEWRKPYMCIRLPSGHRIFYYKPRLENRMVWTGRMIKRRSRGYFEDGAPAGQIVEVEEVRQRTVFTYMGKHQNTGKWIRLEGHGGVFTENTVQALTRDILMVGLRRLHRAGFYLGGHAHDEAKAITRVGENYHTLELMRELMTQEIDGLPGFPLNAAGWVAPYYRKA